jgi:FemAB family protein
MNIVSSDRPQFPELWRMLWERAPLQHPLCQPLEIEYSKAYAEESSFSDLSFILEEGGMPILGLQQSLRTCPKGPVEISAYGRPVFYLETTQEISARQRDGAYKIMRVEVERLRKQHHVDSMIFQDFLVGGNVSALGKWMMESGASAVPHFSQVLDLSVSIEALHQQCRHSYKSLLNWGKKNLVLQILDSENCSREHIQEFRSLHIRAAGRETRSVRTWDIQYDMIRNGIGFAVFGFLAGELVTAAYFNHSAQYCYYGVSASNRELFDRPLSHSVLWEAILHAKKLGCRYFEMGEMLYPNHGARRPTEKEIGIGTFKRGFGGQAHVRLNIILNAPATDAGGSSMES